MSKTFDEIVNQYTSPESEWQISIGGTDFTGNIDYFEFEYSVNASVSMNMKASGIGARNLKVVQNQEIVIKKQGFELFRGIIQKGENKTGGGGMIQATGFAGELEAQKEKTYKPDDNATATEIVDFLVDGYKIETGNGVKEFSTSYDLGTTVNVDEFRVKTHQLKDLNRLMNEYGLEWYITFDGNNEPVLNVTDQIINTADDGSAVGTFRTSEPGQNAREISQTTNKNEGDYEGLVVRGYGDGDDQITASAKRVNVVSSDKDNDTFTVEGDVTGSLSNGDLIKISQKQGLLGGGNSSNEGEYTVSSTSYDSNNEQTTVSVNEDVTDDSGGLLSLDNPGTMVYPVDLVGDARTKIYTDKTILSQDEAEKAALRLLAERSIAWREIKVKPADSKKMYGIGNVYKVEEDEAKANAKYRVVESYYKIRFDQNESESEIKLSSKPASFYDDFSNLGDTTKSQTDYMQGARNVWGEKEVSNATNAKPFTMDFQVPEDVVDVAGNNRLKRVELNYSTQRFQSGAESDTIQATNFDPGTKVVSTDVGSGGVKVERSNIKNHSHAVGSATSRGGSDQHRNNSISFTGEELDSNSWEQIGTVLNAPNPEEDLAHSFQLELTEVNNSGGDPVTRNLFIAYVAKDFVANFNIDPATPFAGETATLTDNSNLDGFSDWFFGDGGSIDGSTRADDGEQVEHEFLTYNISSSDTSTNEITVSSDSTGGISSGNTLYVPESDTTYTVDSISRGGGETVVTVQNLEVDESGNTAQFEGVVNVTMDLLDSGDNRVDTVTKQITVAPPRSASANSISLDGSPPQTEAESLDAVSSESIVAQAGSFSPNNPDSGDTHTMPYTGGTGTNLAFFEGITAVDESNNIITVPGDKTKLGLTAGDIVGIYSSDSNDGDYDVTSVSYDSANDETNISLGSSVTDDNDNGSVNKHLLFNGSIDFDESGEFDLWWVLRDRIWDGAGYFGTPVYEDFNYPSGRNEYRRGLNLFEGDYTNSIQGPGIYDVQFQYVTSTGNFERQVEPVYVCYMDLQLNEPSSDITTNDTAVLLDFEYFAGEALSDLNILLDGSDITTDPRVETVSDNSIVQNGSSVLFDDFEQKTWDYTGGNSTIELVDSSEDMANLEVDGTPTSPSTGDIIGLGDGHKAFVSKVVDTEGTDFNGDTYEIQSAYLEQYEQRQVLITGLNPGNHTIELEAEYNGDNDNLSNTATLTESVDVTVDANDTPTSDFSISPIEPDIGQSIDFTDQSTDPEGDGTIIAWEWDFSDGTTEFVKDAAVTVEKNGNLYQVQDGEDITGSGYSATRLEEILLNSHEIEVSGWGDRVEVNAGEETTVTVDGNEVTLAATYVEFGGDLEFEGDATITVDGSTTDVDIGDEVGPNDNIKIVNITSTGPDGQGVVSFAQGDRQFKTISFGETGLDSQVKYVEDNPQPNGTNPDTAHTYNSENIYQASLQVWDDNGLSDISYQVIAFGVDGRTVMMDSAKDVGVDYGLSSSDLSSTTEGRTVKMDSFPDAGNQIAPTGDFKYRNQTYIPYQDIASNYEVYAATSTDGVSFAEISGNVRLKQINHTHDIPRRGDFNNTDPEIGAGAEQKEIEFSKAKSDEDALLLDFSDANEKIVLDTTLNGNEAEVKIANEDASGNLSNSETLSVNDNDGTTVSNNSYQDEELYVEIISATDKQTFELRSLSGDVSYPLALTPTEAFSSSSETQKREEVSKGDGSEQDVAVDVQTGLLEGQQADSYRIFIDDEPDSAADTEQEITSDFYSSDTDNDGNVDSGTPKDKELDISDYVDNPGWYRLKLVPDKPTFTKARVYLDHHKDTE